MDELGTVLREAREAQGMTLAQAQLKTRISQKFLAALESGDYGALPTAVHVRGYLRNYARFLGLDPEPLIQRYEVSRNYQAPPIPTKNNPSVSPANPLPDRTDQPFFNPINFDIDSQKRDPESLMRIAIIVALLVFIALAVNRFFFSNQGSQTDVSDAVNAILNPTSELEEQPAAESTPNLTETEIIPTSRNIIELPEIPTATPTRVKLPATMETIQLKLEITRRTWLEVTIDGGVVYQGQGRIGDKFEWTAQTEAILYTGDGSSIFVTINNIELGKLGAANAVIRERWITTGN